MLALKFEQPGSGLSGFSDGLWVFSVRERYKCSILAIVNESNSVLRNLYLKAAADISISTNVIILSRQRIQTLMITENSPLSPPSGSIQCNALLLSSHQVWFISFKGRLKQEEGVHFGMFHYICPINIYMNTIYIRVKEAPELPVCLLLPDNEDYVVVSLSQMLFLVKKKECQRSYIFIPGLQYFYTGWLSNSGGKKPFLQLSCVKHIFFKRYKPDLNNKKDFAPREKDIQYF